MKKANLVFKNDIPFSLDFSDYYFGYDGIKEREFVYINSFDFNDNRNFIIAELGFGIGLNFFLTLKKYKNSKIKPKNLFYISIEGFYIDKDDLKNIYKRLNLYDYFKEELEQFLNFYPKCKDGIYRFYFENVFLDLVFGDIKDINRLNFKADVWYLDGFSPSKNMQMFEDDIIKNIARLSKKNALINTFSSSSFLQKILKKYGFMVEKTKGFKKREMIKAKFDHFEFLNTKAYFESIYNDKNIKNIAIIGAGISSAVLAYELSLRDVNISIFEKEEDLGFGASGNESGILSSLILQPNVALGEFSQNSYIEASRFYKQNLFLNFDGVVEIAYNDLMKKRFNFQINNPLFSIKENQAYLEDGGGIFPKKIVKKLFEKSKAKLFFNHEFIDFVYKDDNFKLNFKNKTNVEKFDILIYAMGADTKDFLKYEFMNLSKVRGQVTHLKPFLHDKKAYSSKAYICPINNDFQVIGASYDRLNNDKNSILEDDLQNIENIKEFFSDKVEILNSKVGFRSYSSDRFCIVGNAYNELEYKNIYKKLFWNKNKEQPLPSYISNLYLNFAHGSRGFSSSILAARYICSLIFKEPLGFYNDFIENIHPARFLIRKLKKGL